jgi:SAM-dependent methyltransferase
MVPLPGAPPEARYTIEGGRAGKARLDVLNEVIWPTSSALLASVGVPDGGHVLDLGCGGGHVSLELARMVGQHGSVVGIDLDAEIIDLARADAAGVANVEFRVGTAGEIQGGPFDLAYARFLLSHVADPFAVVSLLSAAVVPGGLVVVEDVDFRGAFCHPPSVAYQRSVDLYTEVCRRQGGNAEIGPALPGFLLGAGLEDVHVGVVQPVALAGSTKDLCHLTLARTAASITAAGLAGEAELAELVTELERLAADPTTLVSVPRIVQSWGRVPISRP